MEPFYQDPLVSLFHGSNRDERSWLAADVLVTDPPYGRAWKQGRLTAPHVKSNAHEGIAGDLTTDERDRVLAEWRAYGAAIGKPGRPVIMFGDLMLPPPEGTKLVLAYLKPTNAGIRGATGGFRRDLEAIYLIDKWKSGLSGRSSVLATAARTQSSPAGITGRYGHPHAKPLDVMAALIAACPPGVIADPFAGSGSTLVAARDAGRKVIGVELELEYCTKAAQRLSQGGLFDTSEAMGSAAAVRRDDSEDNGW